MTSAACPFVVRQPSSRGLSRWNAGGGLPGSSSAALQEQFVNTDAESDSEFLKVVQSNVARALLDVVNEGAVNTCFERELVLAPAAFGPEMD